MGGLAALLPLAALIPLALLALPVTVTLTGGKKRKRRGLDEASSMNQTFKDAAVLNTFIQAHDLSHTNIHKDIVARYLECEGGGAADSGIISCLERLTCLTHDRSANITKLEHQVANIVVRTVLDNRFLSGGMKRQLLSAGQIGHTKPGSCLKFKCNHALINRLDPVTDYSVKSVHHQTKTGGLNRGTAANSRDTKGQNRGTVANNRDTKGQNRDMFGLNKNSVGQNRNPVRRANLGTKNIDHYSTMFQQYNKRN